MDNNLILTTEMFEEAKKYWQDNLGGELVDMDFPGDYSRTGQYDRKSFKLSLGEQAAHKLTKISKNNDFLLDVILLTVFKILIYKFSGQNDIIVSSPVLKTSCQDYNKSIALRSFLSPGMTFKELLQKVKETAIDGYKYQYYPIRELIKLLKIENPMVLFQFVFLLENIHEKEFVPGITGNGRNDITFSVNKNDESLEGEIAYNSNLFKEETIQRLYNGYKRILTRVLSDPNIKLADIDTLTGDEKKKILADFNNTGAKYPKDKTLQRLFDELVEQKQKSDHIVCVEMSRSRPDSIRCISYKELSERANRLAIQLCRKGAVPGSLITLVSGHSIDLLVGMLGILKAGCVYLPLDPEYPADRINLILRDSSSRVVLVSADLADKCESYRFEGEIIEISSGEIGGLEKRSPLARLTVPNDPAYVIYTSGSTGRPKGVIVEHRNVVRLVKNTNYINFSRQDHMLPTGAIAFDISTFEIWGPLLNGVKIYFIDEPAILDPKLLAKVIIENEITILHLTPQLFNQTAAQKIELFAGLKYLLVGGDVVRPRYINELRNRYKNLRILHMYGPTENTTFSTYFPVDKNYEVNIPIGKPISNSTAYILDRFFNLQPIGSIGELCAGGDGIARGYLNNQELTAEKFVSNPFIPGLRLYRTGDLTRWLPDGNIEFLGRRDNQVKIRGYRIELGEIERVLTAHAKIEEAIIVIKRDEEENLYLCGYFTAGEEIEISELRKYLAVRLPDHMIPLFFIPLDKMPLTPNGKIDRNALPEPKVRSGDDYAAPRDEVEIRLVEIWSSVLGIGKDVIGIDANFFELGGHSLKATLLALSIDKELHVKMSMNQVFEMPTIREVAKYIKGAEKHKHSPIEPVEKKEYYPLSSAQMRLYVIQHLYNDSVLFNKLTILTLEGNVEKEKLDIIFRELVKRHEAFRTSFELIDGEPVQRIYEDVKFEIEYYEARVEEQMQEESSIIGSFLRPFDLSGAPLLRLGIINEGESKYILIVDIHHIITDGNSMRVLIRDFMALYEGHFLQSLKLQYKDFSEWQNKLFTLVEIEKQEEYWLNQFKGEIPHLNLPTDYPARDLYIYKGEAITFEIDKELTAGIKKLVITSRTTLFVALLTVFNILLSKYTGQDDIVVGTGLAGRRHADLDNIIGFFINMLAMRNRPEPGKIFIEFLKEVKENTIDAYDNQDYQFEELVKKLHLQGKGGGNPLFDVVLQVQNIETAKLEIPGLTLKYHEDENAFVRFGLVVYINDDTDRINMNIAYSTALFKRSTAQDIARHFCEILKQVVDNSSIILNDIAISEDLLEAKSSVLQLEEVELGW